MYQFAFQSKSFIRFDSLEQTMNLTYRTWSVFYPQEGGEIENYHRHQRFSVLPYHLEMINEKSYILF